MLPKVTLRRENSAKTTSPSRSKPLPTNVKSGTSPCAVPPPVTESDPHLCDRSGSSLDSRSHKSSGSGPALPATKGKSKIPLPSWNSGSRIEKFRSPGIAGSQNVTPCDKSLGPPALVLPLDVLRHLLLLLESVTDILACGAVCHVWRTAVQDEEVCCAFVHPSRTPCTDGNPRAAYRVPPQVCLRSPILKHR